MSNFVGVDEAAEIYGTSPKTIEKLIEEGEVGAAQIRSDVTGLLNWKMSREELEKYFAHRQSGFGGLIDESKAS